MFPEYVIKKNNEDTYIDMMNLIFNKVVWTVDISKAFKFLSVEAAKTQIDDRHLDAEIIEYKKDK